MSKHFILPEGGKFYKANLHTHTIISDGNLTPEQIKQEYQKRGYSIVAYTDHRAYNFHKELCDESFIALAAFEGDVIEPIINKHSWNTSRAWHFNFYDKYPEKNCEEKRLLGNMPFDYDSIDKINMHLAEMRRQGFLISYNHPYWSLQNYSDYKNIQNCFAIEIYNHGCEVEGMYGYNPQCYDEILRTGSRIYCTATDDNHNRANFDSPFNDSFGGFVMIKAEEFTYDCIINSLEAGAFYSSFGPEIYSCCIEDNKLYIECTESTEIYLTSQGRHTQVRRSLDNSLTSAVFELTGQEVYLRVTCRDKNGKCACTNAVFTDTLKQ